MADLFAQVLEDIDPLFITKFVGVFFLDVFVSASPAYFRVKKYNYKMTDFSIVKLTLNVEIRKFHITRMLSFIEKQIFTFNLLKIYLTVITSCKYL